MQRLLHFFSAHYRSWLSFTAIIRALNRREELRRLERWARQRRLEGPLRLYRSRLEDEERRLTKYALRYPRLYRWSHLVHFISVLVSPRPRARKGDGAIYRYRR
jgi:hypothetical protein